MKVVIFGTGGFAEIIHMYLTRDANHEVVAFTIHKKHITEKEFLGIPIVPFEEIVKTHPPDKFTLFVAVGYSENNKKRARIFAEAKEKGYKLLSYVHSSTKLWKEFEMGENCFVFENNTIQPFVKLGNDVIIWSGNVISHHTTIKDHCFIVSHAAIAGNVTIEPYCFVGMNATIRNRIKIAKECIIGAGAVILEDTNEGEVYVAGATKKIDIKSDHLKQV